MNVTVARLLVDHARNHFVHVDEHGVDGPERGGAGDVDDVRGRTVLGSTAPIELVDRVELTRVQLVEDDPRACDEVGVRCRLGIPGMVVGAR